MKFKRFLCFLLVALLAISSLVACSKDEDDNDDKKASSKEEAKEEKKDVHLTYWMGNYASGGELDNYGDMESVQKIHENLGITVDYIHPSSAAWEESFNIMIASQDYTDMIYWNWGTKYNGGVEGAYADGIAIDLTDKLDKLPNYAKILKENPDIDKTLRTTDGKLLSFATIKEDTSLNSCYGPMIRKDWLDKLGLAVPTTIDEWHTVLTAFKTQDPNGNGQADEIPFADTKSAAFKNFAGAFGTRSGIYVKNGKVVYGFMEPEYKEFVTEMAKWYSEGLLDSEYAALDSTIANAYMTNNTAGSTIAYIGSGMGTYLVAGASIPGYDIVAAPWPSKAAGKPNYIPQDFDRITGTDTVGIITTTCKDLDSALRYMDYFYSEEATVLLNWGIEGKSYVIEKGGYKLTDLITNNPDGKTPIQAMGLYTNTTSSAPQKIMDSNAYAALTYSKPQQRDASILWNEGDRSLMTLEWPLTAEEKLTLSEIKANITAYENEVFTKMVMGYEPISNYDNHIAELKNRGIDEMLSIYQKAYDRFMAD